MRLGFDLPNVPVPTSATWQQVDELRSSIVKVRPYHLSLSTREHIQQRKLGVILRNNSDDGVAFDPRARIDELRAAIEAVQTYTQTLYVIVDNEPNHSNNNARPSSDYWARVRQVFETLALEFPAVQFISPPMAVAQNEAEWYAAGRDVIALFDFVGVHLYGQTDNSLVTYALQLASVFDKPLIADEVGNTDLHLGGDNKAFAVASYLRQAAEAGVEAATIFIAKDPTPEWAYCTLPTHKLAMIADSVPQEVAMPTVEQLGTPTATPGGVVEMPLRITGISETPLDLVTLDVAYPIIPGTDESRYGGNALGRLDVADDGIYTARVQLAPLAAPLPGPVFGELRGNLLSNTGATVTNVPFGPFYFAIQPEGAAPEQPAPVVTEPTDQDQINHSLMTIHFSAGDAFNRTKNPIFEDIQRAVAAFKAGQSFSWPQR